MYRMIRAGRLTLPPTIDARISSMLVPLATVVTVLLAGIALWVIALRKGLSTAEGDIAERRRAEDRVRLLAHGLQSANDCITITDTADHILYVNEAFLRTYEYQEQELLGQHINIVRAPDNDPAVVDGILEATKRDGWRGVVWNRSKSGRVFPISLASSMVHDERGEVVAAVGVARDMTKEKADEETLRASEEKFFKIFQASPDCIAIVDFGSGGVLDVNERFEEITGYARSEILGRTFTDLELLVDATLRKTMVSKLHESGSIRDFEYQMRRKSGDIATISWSAEVIEIAGRRCFVSVHRDVTGQKTAEESLHRTETKYSEVVENASDIIFTLDRDGYFLSMNRAGREISGYAPEDSRGLNLRQLVVPEQAEMAARQIERVLGGERVPTFELEIVGRAGKRLTVELDVRAIHDKDACIGVQGIARDVSMRKELEAQLRQAQKMEAIGLLAGGIAHDFNNLLTAILGYAELATRRLDPDSAVREDLEEIQRAASSAESLTRQLLIFSRKGVVQPAVLDVNELVGRLDRMLRRVVGDDIDFIVTLGPDAGHINADGGQIEQVIMNLVVNARDAMPGGGTLTLETAAVQLDDGFVSAHPGSKPGAHVRLSVSDTGSGMTPDVQAQIFTPFFTTKGPNRGTGLGLATVHGIVQQSSGYIAVESILGSGATFTIYLPRVAACAENAGTSAEAGAVDGAACTILLVDDDDSIRAMGARALREYGHTVLPARHAAEALNVAEHHGSKIDLLFTDIVMPGIDGRALARQLQLSRSDLKVLYTTGHTDDSEALRDVQAAGADFLLKPYTPESLARKVRGVLDRA
jgi:two-component system cell cycle sensor histidine kinase/response regulator CckA